MYDSPLSSLSIDHIYVAFCAYVSPQAFFRSYTIPTPVLLCCPVRAGNTAYLITRILFRPHLLPRVVVGRRSYNIRRRVRRLLPSRTVIVI